MSPELTDASLASQLIEDKIGIQDFNCIFFFSVWSSGPHPNEAQSLRGRICPNLWIGIGLPIAKQTFDMTYFPWWERLYDHCLM